MGERRGWLALAGVVAASFGVLLWGGREIWRMAPPVPEKVVDAQGQVLFTKAQIQDGQSSWQSMGGQETGTVWGHGAYVAPDWSADQLHREAVALDSILATRANPEQAETQMRREMRHNGWDPSTKTVTISVERAQAVREVSAHWDALFGGDPSLSVLRSRYALRDTALPDSTRRADLSAFFWWTSWACVAQRPGGTTSYTNNWPHEPLVGNEPSSSLLLWSMASVLVVIAGIALLALRHAAARKEEPHAVPAKDPLRNLVLTASMRAALPYFAVVALLLAAQVGLGGIVAHYGVEGNGFYGLRLDKFLPYAIGRTWHVQMGIFWIATSWLATGLFLSPAAGGREPKRQAIGVVALLGALLVVVAGSFTGEWLGVFQKLGFAKNFWLGHQGLAYVDLGRFWQILLLVGLVFWFYLVLRALLPALRKGPEGRSLVWLFALSAGAIALFYGAGMMWGRHTHLSMVEYWRWWVVHLWVEGFFEVFATAAIGFLFSRMGLVAVRSAGLAAVEATAIFLGGGIIGTFHHLYFTGTPTSILALGSVFSALEIVPLALVALEAVGNWRLRNSAPWMERWKWPFRYLMAVAFWNCVGAGLFGFLINPPIALYYMQGLNLTPLHGHTALFGVYGFLGLGFSLFCLRAAAPDRAWSDRWTGISFWGLNIGLSLMVLLSLLPIGILQTMACIDHGLWWARSSDFLYQPLLVTLKWMRLPGDIIFAGSALILSFQFFRLVFASFTTRKETP